MQTNADITIYNKKYDPETRTDKYYRTVLLGCSAYVNTNASAVNNAGRNENTATFRIPPECDKFKNYMPEEEYEYCAHPENFWTLQTGDLIVLGVCPINPLKSDTMLSAAHIKAFRIKSISDNRRGTTPHLRARCE